MTVPEILATVKSVLDLFGITPFITAAFIFVMVGAFVKLIRDR